MSTRSTAMQITRGLTYRRLVTWDRPGVPADYTARLVVYKRQDTASAQMDISSPENLVMGGAAGAITVTIKLTPDQTAALPIGTEYRVMLILALAADATENWGVQWDASVRSFPRVVV